MRPVFSDSSVGFNRQQRSSLTQLSPVCRLVPFGSLLAILLSGDWFMKYAFWCAHAIPGQRKLRHPMSAIASRLTLYVRHAPHVQHDTRA
eukprot:75640-Amphidinium_carterae.1